MAAPTATRETVSRPYSCGQATPRPRRSIPQMLRRRFGDLTTAHVADGCLQAGVPVQCGPPGTRPVVTGGRAVAGWVLPTRHVGSVDHFLEAVNRAAWATCWWWTSAGVRARPASAT
ncbi:hypothetical protein [Micromonospora sp. NPDC047740]|uniref:hypothetical protein n=1 Tax=Micromonospora sp. NPDC047740 TaxID=3364254 RepID=UPI00371DD918